MYIKKVALHDFRNYEAEEITLQNGINVFYGNNAQGKTNILEAIFLCAIGKSFRTNKDKEMIFFDKSNACIELDFQKEDREGNIKIELGEKKCIYLNGVPLKKLSELLGNVYIVIFSPDDMDILRGAPSKRRRFLDIMIGQLRPNYVHVLNLYSKTLEQRNSFLKQLKVGNNNSDMLDVWDENLAKYGESIYNYRREFIQKISNKLGEVHDRVTEGKEKIEIKYESDFSVKDEFIKSLQSERKQDIFKGFTNKGVHRDDFMIYINNTKVNVYGSQGQNRTAILSLKLTEMEVIEDEIGEKPILLLDDFMSELDNNRRRNFLRRINDRQVLITCTDKMTLANLKILSYKVISGSIKREEN